MNDHKTRPQTRPRPLPRSVHGYDALTMLYVVLGVWLTRRLGTIASWILFLSYFLGQRASGIFLDSSSLFYSTSNSFLVLYVLPFCRFGDTLLVGCFPSDPTPFLSYPIHCCHHHIPSASDLSLYHGPPFPIILEIHHTYLSWKYRYLAACIVSTSVRVAGTYLIGIDYCSFERLVSSMRSSMRRFKEQTSFSSKERYHTLLRSLQRINSNVFRLP
jgi:hypothetical protein